MQQGFFFVEATESPLDRSFPDGFTSWEAPTKLSVSQTKTVAIPQDDKLGREKHLFFFLFWLEKIHQNDFPNPYKIFPISDWDLYN